MTDAQPRNYGGPFIAKDPTRVTHLAIAYDLRFPFEQRFQNACRLAISYTLGAQWTNRTIIGAGGLYPTPPGYEACSRSTVAFAPDGTLYYFAHVIHFVFGEFREGLYILVSHDGGTTFSPPRAIDPAQEARSREAAGAGDEQVMPAVDQRTGRVHVAWVRYTPEFCCGSTVLTSHSDDGGQSFSAPVAVSTGPPEGNEWPAISVGTDSAVYVNWIAEGLVSTVNQTLPLLVAFSASHDGGKTFGPSKVLAAASNGCQSSSCFDEGDFTAVPFVQNGSGAAPGLVIVAWSGSQDLNVGPAHSHPGPVRIYVQRSTDGGATFSAPQVVGIPSDRPNDRQHHPWVSFSPRGRIDIAYYDSTPDVAFEDTYMTSSLDYGVTFGPGQRISNVSSPTNAGFLFNDNYSIGRLIDSTVGLAFVTWTDSRRGTVENGKTDVMFARERRREPAASPISPATGR